MRKTVEVLNIGLASAIGFFSTYGILNPIQQKLSWDDSDYLRMIFCIRNSILTFDGSGFLHCQAGLYKAPIFANILSVPAIAGEYLFHGMDNSDQLSIALVMLTVMIINTFLSYRILKNIKSALLCTVYLLLFFQILNKFNYLFMTDLMLALIMSNILMEFTKLLANRTTTDGNLNYLEFRIGLGIAAAGGIKLSAMPLLALIPIYAIHVVYNSSSRNRQLAFNRVLQISLPPILLVIMYLSLWKSALVAGGSMFKGGQAAYYLSWNKNGISHITDQLTDYFGLAVYISIAGLLLLCIKFRKDYIISVALRTLPLSIGFILYNISLTQETRFLLPIVLPLLSTIFLDADRLQISDIATVNQVFIRRGALLAFMFASTLTFGKLGSSELGLSSAKEIYERIPKSGVVCPLSDSPNINISKMLLIDALNNNQKNLNSRILNIPDSAMMGMNQSQVVNEIREKCDFAYAEKEIVAGTYKNEFLDSAIIEASKWEFVKPTRDSLVFRKS